MTAPTPEDRRFPALNAVRAVGAFGVVATHTAFDTGEVTRGALGAFLSRLDFGVALFFVLSGFLLSRPFFLAAFRGWPRPSYRHFLWKRALRILPLYWVTVVVALLLLPENADATRGDWLRNLTLTQIYAPGLLPAGLTQMWSLATEVAFYAVLPAGVFLLLWIARLLGARAGEPRPGRVLVLLAVASVLGFAWQTVAASTSDPTAEHLHQWLPGFVPWFAVGMAFAVVSAHQAAVPSERWQVLDRLGSDLLGSWLVAASVFVIACTPVAGPRILVPPTPGEALVKSVLYTVSAAFFVLPLVFGPEEQGIARRIASSRPAVWLGDVSYGIFCLHLLVLDRTMRSLGIEEFTGQFGNVFAVTVVGTTIVAAASFYLLERPFLRLKNAGPFATAAADARPSPSRARS